MAKISATDQDQGSKLAYSLDLATQAYMEIDSESGQLTLTQSIDREEYETFKITIFASDGLHTAEYSKVIEVEDVNDNAPIFKYSYFSMEIFESAEQGAIVGRIEATDLDKYLPYKQLSYSLISEWGGDTFSMDPSTGMITLIANLPVFSVLFTWFY